MLLSVSLLVMIFTHSATADSDSYPVIPDQSQQEIGSDSTRPSCDDGKRDQSQDVSKLIRGALGIVVPTYGKPNYPAVSYPAKPSHKSSYQKPGYKPIYPSNPTPASTSAPTTATHAPTTQGDVPRKYNQPRPRPPVYQAVKPRYPVPRTRYPAPRPTYIPPKISAHKPSYLVPPPKYPVFGSSYPVYKSTYPASEPRYPVYKSSYPSYPTYSPVPSLGPTSLEPPSLPPSKPGDAPFSALGYYPPPAEVMSFIPVRLTYPASKPSYHAPQPNYSAPKPRYPAPPPKYPSYQTPAPTPSPTPTTPEPPTTKRQTTTPPNDVPLHGLGYYPPPAEVMSFIPVGPTYPRLRPSSTIWTPIYPVPKPRYPPPKPSYPVYPTPSPTGMPSTPATTTVSAPQDAAQQDGLYPKKPSPLKYPAPPPRYPASAPNLPVQKLGLAASKPSSPQKLIVSLPKPSNAAPKPNSPINIHRYLSLFPLLPPKQPSSPVLSPKLPGYTPAPPDSIRVFTATPSPVPTTVKTTPTTATQAPSTPTPAPYPAKPAPYGGNVKTKPVHDAPTFEDTPYTTERERA